MIDENKLKRDYKENPLKKMDINTPTGYMFEKPFKEDLEYLYIDLNMSQKELWEYFGVTRCILQHWIKEFGIKKDPKKMSEVMRKTMKLKYGVEYSVQCKESKKKAKKTKLERYGNERYNNRKKSVETCLKEYGCNNVNQRHLTTECIEVLSSKENLEKYIKDNNVINCTELAEKIGIGESAVAKYVRNYNLTYLMDYSKSLIEKTIKEYISKYYQPIGNYKLNDSRQEIDIYIPKLNIGIEINGNYWHGEKQRDSLYHQEKSKLAEEQGIFIYHIFEYEWNNKREQILNQLNNLLGINQEKIGARKCVIREVKNTEKREFLEKNHLQGDDNSSVKLGLYYNEELVSLMTFCKPRFNKKYEWELSRFCSKACCNVIGGASKLFKHFVNEYSPKSIISYSNIAHTRGNLYGTLGFTLDGISEPNYIWLKNGLILTRYQCQKHKLFEQGFEGNSEVEIMHNRGFYKIYDCGNKVWIYENTIYVR